ncbi:ankyrin repeat domain-containing protein, partial [Candidatus Babeliales bacterium]|nr:ankyrin repeat domain-containing protein [Candidatus Babeliales bacterium]
MYIKLFIILLQSFSICFAGANFYNQEVKQMLNENKEECLALNKFGWAPIHYAAAFNATGAIRSIAKQFPDSLNFRSNDGVKSITALDIALKHRSIDAFETLLELGASPDLMENK